MKRFAWICDDCGGFVKEVEMRDIIRHYDENGDELKDIREISGDPYEQFECIDCGIKTDGTDDNYDIEDIATPKEVKGGE